MTPPEAGVSVIVATARPDGFVDQCTRAIAQAASRTSEPTELVIVDDRDVPVGERRAPEENVAGLTVRRVWSRDFGFRGQPAARNAGVSVARYDILALTDDDATPDRDWLKFGAQRLRLERDLAGVEGAIRLDRSKPIDSVRSRLVINERGGACTNASMFYRTSAFRAVGGSRSLWRRPPLNYREDSDLAERVTRLVGPIAFEARAFVLHPPEAVGLLHHLRLASHFRVDAVLDRLNPGILPSVRRRPLARVRIRLAVAVAATLPGLAPRRTRRPAALLLVGMTALLSAHIEQELRRSGVRRRLRHMLRDTVLRAPRTLLWAAVAGGARAHGELLVRSGLADLPPERSTLFPDDRA